MEQSTRPQKRSRAAKLFKGAIFLSTGYFLFRTAIAHGHELQSLQFQPLAWAYLSLAVGLLLLSEVVAGLLWFSTLDYLRQSVPLGWSVKTFFSTTLAKYLPGNVWHLVGRVDASRRFGVALERVGLSVILETLFMVSGGVILSLLYPQSLWLQAALFTAMLLLLHPWGVGKIFRFLAWIKHLKTSSTPSNSALQDIIRYPVREMLCGTLFMLLRGTAFSLTLSALYPFMAKDLPHVISGFGMAWSLGIVLPAPGGLGVFESAAVQVMTGVGTPGVLLSTVVLFRFLCLFSESLGAGLVWLA
ncbi:MAG: hypothetical protein AAGB01_02985, partial [Cyanobacteria bacterium P01_F01_bin.42]